MLLAWWQTGMAQECQLTLTIDNPDVVNVSINYNEIEVGAGENIINFNADRYPIIDISSVRGYALDRVLVNGRQQSIIGGSWTETLTEDFEGAIIKVYTRELVKKTVTFDVTGVSLMERCIINGDREYDVVEGTSTYEFDADKAQFDFSFKGNAVVKAWLNDQPLDVTYYVQGDSYLVTATITENATLKIVATENQISPATLNITGSFGIRTLFIDEELQTYISDYERTIRLTNENASMKINLMPGATATVTVDGVNQPVANGSSVFAIHGGSSIQVVTDILPEEEVICVEVDNPEDVALTTGTQNKAVKLNAGLNKIEATSPRHTITFTDNGKPHLVTLNGQYIEPEADSDGNVYSVYLNASYYNQLKIVTNASYTVDNTQVGIDSIEAGRGDGVIYNIHGMRVNSNLENLKSLPAGVYIVDGKKVIVK